MRDHVNALLKSFETPGAPFLLNEQRCCSMLVDGDLECNLELDELGEWVYLHTPIIRIPIENRSEIFARLLQANCFGIGTDGGHLGICDRSQAVIYSRRYQSETLGSQNFRDLFDRFVAVALVLRDDFSATATSIAAERSQPHASDQKILPPSVRV